MASNFPGGPKGAMINPSNDFNHNQVDPTNRSGGPRYGQEKRIPLGHRGGFGQHGQKVYNRAQMPSGRSGSAHPAGRGGASIGAFTPDRAIPNHGGSAQHGDRMRDVSQRGGFGTPPHKNAHAPGQVRDYSPANPKPSAGNTSGRSYRLIAGRFKRAAMGAKANAPSGKYGSPPIDTNT